MSYSDFINTFSNGFNLFYNSLVSVANNLLNNYIFITLLGLVLFTSFFHFLISFISSRFSSSDNSIEYKGGKK